MKLITAGANTDPANGGGKAIMYGSANLDAVSPQKLNQLVKTQEGDYARPNIDHGYGEDQFYGQPHLFDKFRNPLTKKAVGGLIDRQYQTDGNPRATWAPNSRDSMDYGVKARYKAGELSPIESLDKMAKGGWIQGAVNPAHKGYCTPMTKSTCTGARRRFALTMKKHHGFHEKELGGALYNNSQLDSAPPAIEYLNRKEGKNPHLPGFGPGGELPAKSTNPLSTNDFKLIPWKSLGVTDSTGYAPLYEGTFGAFQRVNNNKPIPGADPNQVIQAQSSNVDALFHPAPVAPRPIPALNIQGTPSASAGVLGHFRPGGKMRKLAKKCTGGSMRFSGAGNSAWKGGKSYG